MDIQMMKNLSVISILSSLASLGFTTPANALSANLSWTGSNYYYLTGSFSYVNTNPDDFIRSSDNEITSFQVSFYDNNNTLLTNYNLTQLLAAPSSFNFNYQISTGQILKTGASNTQNGFSIGSNPNGSSGYVLYSAGGAISLLDIAQNFPLDKNGTLTTATVPFDFDSNVGLTVLGCFWGINILSRKKSS